MLMSNLIPLALLSALIAINLVIVLLFVLSTKLSESRLKEAIRDIIFALDTITDEMENDEKRRKAIDQINEILGWERIVIPTALIGWVIDTEVATIRKIQQYTNSQSRFSMRKITFEELKEVALQSKEALQALAEDNDRPIKLYLHWSAGH